jgi:hypothetical protein
MHFSNRLRVFENKALRRMGLFGLVREEVPGRQIQLNNEELLECYSLLNNWVII